MLDGAKAYIATAPFAVSSPVHTDAFQVPLVYLQPGTVPGHFLKTSIS